MGIKPIETVYKGYKFRSRLEARWAVFFDQIGCKWEYEPEGFDLGGGVYYLPDFLIHNVYGRYKGDLWFEVKGNMTMQDAEKIQRFAYGGMTQEQVMEIESTGTIVPITNPIMIVGAIPTPDDLANRMETRCYTSLNNTDMYEFNLETVDGDHFGAMIYMKRGGGMWIDDDNQNYYEPDCIDSYYTHLAYLYAQQIRF